MPGPDPKREGRIRDPQLLRELHGHWRSCALCGGTDSLSLHHILKHPRDDLEENLVMLCGDGVRGCHGRIEAHDELTRLELSHYLRTQRPDVVAHIMNKMGPIAAADWFVRVLGS